jgi:hypothetical protein
MYFAATPRVCLVGKKQAKTLINNPLFLTYPSFVAN